MKYKNILWDWNGTILNDTPVAFEATNILLKRYDYPTITLEFYRDNMDTPIVNFYSKIFDLNKHDMQMLDDEWGVMYHQLSDKNRTAQRHCDFAEFLCGEKLPSGCSFGF